MKCYMKKHDPELYFFFKKKKIKQKVKIILYKLEFLKIEIQIKQVNESSWFLKIK